RSVAGNIKISARGCWAWGCSARSGSGCSRCCSGPAAADSTAALAESRCIVEVMMRPTVVVFAVGLGVFACQSQDREAKPEPGDPAGKDSAPPPSPDAEASRDPSRPFTIDGFATPESVLHDRIDDVYLVSNVNGAPDAKDGNGLVSRVAASGELLAREWTTGEPSLASGPLHAPKGMALLGDLLAVTDIDVVRFFDRRTGKAEFSVGTVGWTFLNDLVADGEGGLLVTDTGTAGEGD